MKFKIDKLFILITVLVGLFSGIILEVLYRAGGLFSENRIITITLYLTIFAILVGIALVIKGFVTQSYSGFVKVILITLAALVGFSGFSALFEFIYELEGDPIQFNSTSLQYAFLIDDSSSMLSSDPDDERYEAVEKIINNLDETKDFAVYNYADFYECETRMGSVSSKKYRYNPSGSMLGSATATLSTIRAVVNETGNPTRHTKIIILTDGEPTDDGFGDRNRTINNCIMNNCSVSFVGFGYVNEEFMTDVAYKTGGTYVLSSDLDDLMYDLEKIVKAKVNLPTSRRDLLGERPLYKSFDFLHCILRILFLSILGAMWTAIKMILIGEKKFSMKAAVVSVISCSVAAVLVEVMTIIPLYGIIGTLPRILFCILWAFTIVHKVIDESGMNYAPGELNAITDFASGRNRENDLNKNYRGVNGPNSFL